MGTQSDALKADLERSVLLWVTTFEAVGDRVSPGRMVERRRFSRWAVLPEPAQSGDGDRRPRPLRGERPDPSAGSSIADTAGTAKDRAADVASTAVDKVTGAPSAATSATEGNPLAAGLIALGAGMLGPSLLPATQKEHHLVDQQVRPVLDEARTEAKSIAQDAAEHLKPAAQDAATTVRDEAQVAAQHVQGDAQVAKEHVQGDAQLAKENVRSDATTAADQVRSTPRS